MVQADDPPGLGWVSREVEAMVAAWDRGEDATARAAIDGCAEVDSESAIRLIYEEVCLRREAGRDVDTAEVVRQHPRWGGELRALFDCDRLIRSPHQLADFPKIGEALGPFVLLAELGRGGFGRTYLASDPGLADRPVVVKVIPDDQDEHLALARLRHTHIVPLFSEHSFPERGLRGLCMPFLGGASLAQILDDMADVPVGQRTGKLLVKLIDRRTPEIPSSPPADGPFRRGLEQASYVQAMTWIAACLADALQYAHARGLVHMDIKPSNVLITMDGQPMLLDFHLARGPMLVGECVADRLGGTPGWMAPEQESAMAAAVDGRPLTAAVDGRADLFALGLLLRESLDGPAGMGSGSRSRRPAVIGTGLSDIVRKCLAPSPDARYRDAATLAGDLRRELNDLPLQGVRNRSWRERRQKWRRRHPGALAWVAAGLVLLAGAGMALGVGMLLHRQMVGQLRVVLGDARRDRAVGRHAEAIRTLERGLEAAGAIPAAEGIKHALRAEHRLAERGRRAGELHAIADRIRYRHGIELPSGGEGEWLLRLCRSIWAARAQVVGNDALPFGPASEREIRDDLLELVAIQADLRVHLAPPDQSAEAREEALRWLDEAEAACGPSSSIDARREQWGAPIGRGSEDGGARRSRSAWEHYERGRHELRSGRFEAAAEEFRLALESRPQEFWPNFFHGLCAYRLRRFEEAAADYRACIVIEPGSAICHYDHALAHDALGRAEVARRGYSRAIELDPGLAAARLNRGILSYKAGRHLEAIADFEAGLRTEASGETRGRLHFNLALAQLATRDRDSARANAEAAVALDCREAIPLSDELR